MVYNAQKYWAVGFAPASGILNTRKKALFRKRNLFLSWSEGKETPDLLGLIRTDDGNNKVYRHFVSISIKNATWKTEWRSYTM
jgi:hypothetical protein